VCVENHQSESLIYFIVHFHNYHHYYSYYLQLPWRKREMNAGQKAARKTLQKRG